MVRTSVSHGQRTRTRGQGPMVPGVSGRRRHACPGSGHLRPPRFVTLHLMNQLHAAAAEWIAGDPDPITRAELQGIVGSGNIAELPLRLGAPLQFGTAGLRGRVDARSNRMNRATVIRATRGLADYPLGTVGTEQGPVVVGRDARLSSATFMEDTIS